MTGTPVTITYLQMLDQARFRPRWSHNAEWSVVQPPRDGALNRDFYRQVGRDWHWVDRLSWSDDDWHVYARLPHLHTWAACWKTEHAGYFELCQRADSGIEIAYFGLLPKYVGLGLGGPLLSAAVAEAWRLQPRRVWLHTCSLDHPHALANYLARGFEIYRIEQQPLVARPTMPHRP